MMIEQSLVERMNELQAGMNFLVPSDWWTEFIQKNHNTQTPQDIRFPRAGPYQSLIQIGLLQEHPESWQQQANGIMRQATLMGQRLASDLRQLKEGGKRWREKWEWLESMVLQGGTETTRVLVCPRLNQQTVLEFGIAALQWKVLSPMLFHLVSQHYEACHPHQGAPHTVAVPVIIPGLASGITDHTYYLGEQMRVTILLKSSSHPQTSAIIVGYMEHKPTYYELLDQAHRGITRLWGDPNKSQLYRQAVVSLGGHIYTTEGDVEDAKWGSFQQIASHTPRANRHLKLIEFSLATNSSEGVSGSKMIKICSGQPGKRTGFVPPVRPSQGNIEQKRARFEQFKSSHPQIISSHLQQTDRASSTEGDTPDAALQAILYDQRVHLHNHNRISHSLWAQCNNSDAFRTLAELKMNAYIPRPFYSDQQLYLKDKEGQRILVDKCCPQVRLNEERELQERSSMDEQQPVDENGPQDMLEKLQRLARGWLMGQSEKAYVKDKSQFESQTCKNQMDEEESRQA